MEIILHHLHQIVKLLVKTATLVQDILHRILHRMTLVQDILRRMVT